jgi:hypothetical protein
LAALRLGDIEKWLGEPALKNLRQAGRNKLVETLSTDFESIARQTRIPTPGGWTMIPIPLLHDDVLSQMRLFVRRQDDDQGGRDNRNEDRAGPVTRFLLNLRLSRMGDMQLDGLMRKKQIDLILRTEDALPSSMREDLARRFADGLGQAQVTGTIGFQAKRQGWVTVEPPPRPGTIA